MCANLGSASHLPELVPDPLGEILDTHGLVILDGALATELERYGCDLDDPLWSARVLIEAPHLIKRVHLDYLAAGADCITTATYQATFSGFAGRGIGAAESAELMRLAVDLAVAARDDWWSVMDHRSGRPKPLVAASIGSYGAFLADGSEYTGDYDLDHVQLQDFHRSRLRVLAESSADLLAFETIPSLHEAEALASLLSELPAAWAWLSFSARDAHLTSHGEPVTDCVRRLARYDQIAAVGINCTSPAYIPELIAAMHTETDEPIVVYPNSGETYCADEHRWQGSTPTTSFAAQAHTWYQAGARIIGGCCRTTPQDIRTLAAWARGSVQGDSTVD